MAVDQVVIHNEVGTQEPEGHAERMIAVAEGREVPPQEAPAERPDWLPEGFNTPEELAKAYSELKTPKAPEQQPEAKPAEVPEDPAKALAEKGLKYEDFSAELARDGKLSPESYDKLAKVGFDKAMVDSYVAGQDALAQQFSTSIKAEIGGDDAYAEMVAWAKVNLSPSEIEVFNQAVSTGNADQAKLAVLGLNARFNKANGVEPRLIQGRPAGSANEDVFESYSQLTNAMRDPRYKNDPAYRAKVQAKLARSNL